MKKDFFIKTVVCLRICDCSETSYFLFFYTIILTNNVSAYDIILITSSNDMKTYNRYMDRRSIYPPPQQLPDPTKQNKVSKLVKLSQQHKLP